MKTLKFRRDLAEQILDGKKNTTWRIFDEKNISKGDKVAFLLWETRQEFVKAAITSVREKKLGDIDETDWHGHGQFSSEEEMIKTFSKYYPQKIDRNTLVKIIKFRLLP